MRWAIAVALMGIGVSGCGHSSSGQSGPPRGPSPAASRHPSVSTAASDGLLTAVQAAAKPASSTLYVGSGAGSRVLEIADGEAKSFHITVSCVGDDATFDSGRTKFFQVTHCEGQRAVYSADVPPRYLHAGKIALVASSRTQWAVEVTAS